MEQIRLDLIPNGIMPNVHASQFDKSRTVRFNLYEGDTPFTLLATDNVKVACNGVDDTTLATAGTSHDWTIPDSVVADSGVFIGELSVERGPKTIGSKNFVLNVEEDAYNGKNIEERTASGSIANFETNLQDNLTACKCEINPLQDLHGYTKPWSGGAGKNKVDFPSYAQASSNGLTIQTTGDGGFKVTGTPSASWAILTSQIDVNIPSGQDITFGIDTALSHRIYIYAVYDDDSTINLIIDPPSTSTSFRFTQHVKAVRLDFASLSTSTNYNETIYPMLEYGSTQSPFVPYENICPISGFSGANIVVADENMVAQSTTAISFGQTVYGGVADVTGGKVTVTHKLVTYNGSENWQFLSPSFYVATPNDCQVSQTPIANEYNGVAPTYYNMMNDGNIALSTVLNNLLVRNDSIASVADFKTALSNNPLTVLYELATPIEITLTPKQIEAIVGINNVFHDCNGEIEVKYLVEV